MDSYFEELKKYSNITCPYCYQAVIPLHFQFHCNVYHGFNSYNNHRCVWCLGMILFWSDVPGEHLLQCFKRFISELPDTFPTDLNSLYEPQNVIMTHSRWISELPTLTKLVPLEHKGLEIAIAAVHMFQIFNHRTDWYHVVVRNYRPLNHIPATQILPFSCLCGSHQHVLYYVKKGLESWKHVNIVRHKRIRSPIELVDALGKVSQMHYRCNLFPNDHTKYVFVPLPSGFEMICALHWYEGFMEYIYRWFDRVDPRVLAPVAQSFNGMWGVCVRDLPGIPQNIVIPVEKGLEPNLFRGQFCQPITQTRNIYFSYNLRLRDLNKDEWVHLQVQKGNSILQILGKNKYYPSPQQQIGITIARTTLLRENQLWSIQKKDKEKKCTRRNSI